MDEKTFEDIICKYTELIETGLILKGRQVFVRGKRVDILFEDRHGQDLLVEIKRGTVLRKHIGQLLDYGGEFINADNPNVREMLVGNRVPENLRRSLDHHGLEWKEISIMILVDYLRNLNDYELLNRLEPEELDTRSQIQPKPDLSYPTNRRQTLSMKKDTSNVYGEEELIDILKNSESYGKFKSVQLQHKIDREQRAWNLIREYTGKYTEEILNKIFDVVETPVRNDLSINHKPWFGPLFNRPNRNNIFNHPISQINRWIETLLFSGFSPDVALNRCLRDDKIVGASKGLVTLLLYLSSPMEYNVWLDKTEKGLRILKYINGLKGSNYGYNYVNFNNAAIRLRNKNVFQPQEMDWVLTFIPSYLDNKDTLYRYY